MLVTTNKSDRIRDMVQTFTISIDGSRLAAAACAVYMYIHMYWYKYELRFLPKFLKTYEGGDEKHRKTNCGLTRDVITVHS